MKFISVRANWRVSN